MDGLPSPSYAVPFSSFNKNKRGKTGVQKLQPNSVKISIPTATKSGRTNIIIDTRRRPNENPEYNCESQIKDKTNVNVIVELKNGKEDNGNSSSTSTAQSSTTHNKNGELIKSRSSTISQSKDQDKDVAVAVDVDELDEDDDSDASVANSGAVPSGPDNAATAEGSDSSNGSTPATVGDDGGSSAKGTS